MAMKDWKEVKSGIASPFDEDYFISWTKGSKELEITPYFVNDKFKHFELWLREGDEGNTIGSSKYLTAVILSAKKYMKEN